MSALGHYIDSMNTTTVSPATVTRSRGVERLVRGQPTSDGAGVKLTRVLTQPLQRRLDPFLMLDAFGSDVPGDYIAGFPDHPHRGFETITYMLAGRMRHRDSAGNEGLLEDGAVQWMTAGRGVIHSELPEQTEGVMEGFQLWLNLREGRPSLPTFLGFGRDDRFAGTMRPLAQRLSRSTVHEVPGGHDWSAWDPLWLTCLAWLSEHGVGKR